MVAGAGMLAVVPGLAAGAPAAARAPLGSGAVGTSSAQLSAAASPAVATVAVGAAQFTQAWTVKLSGATIAQSSPIVATIEGAQAVVVGALNGRVYALNLATGRLMPGWPATVPGAVPVQSAPSVNTSGGHTTIYVGTGDAGHPSPGGYLALNGTGTKKWYRTVRATPANAESSGVQASLTVGTLQGTKSLVAGTLGQYEQELRVANGTVMPGFAWFAADSEFSTPSIANLYGDGHNYIVEGGESTAGNAYGVQYYNGGHIRILNADGKRGQKVPSGGLVCQYNTTQGVESSPAVGGFLKGGAKGIVVGTGNTYKTASDNHMLIAIGPHCGQKWKATLNGSTLDSPALVSALGNKYLQVAEGTSTGHSSGTVYLLNGANGKAIWTHNVGGQVIGGITSANLEGGYQDLLVPTTGGLYVLDGKTGRQIALLGHGAVGLESSPLVTANANGTIGITVAGYNAAGGVITHWDVAGTSGSLATQVGAWPMFHHDPQLTGTTITPAAR